MSHVNCLKIQIPATRVAPISAEAIGRFAACAFRLLDSGAKSAAVLIGTLRPRNVRADLAQVIEQLSEDRPATAVNLKGTLKRVGSY